MAKDFVELDRLERATGLAPEANPKDALVNKFVKAWENQTARRAAKGAAGTTMALTLAACGGSDGAAPAPTPTPPVPQTLTLTVDRDTIVGDGANDTINANSVANVNGGVTSNNDTFTALDSIDGGLGTDTLNITTANPFLVPAGATVVNVEIANITSGGAVAANTTSWTGLTTLNTTAVGDTDLTAAATTNVVAVVTAQAANAIVLDGGNNVTLTASGNTTGTVDIGFVTAAAGNVNATVNSALTADGTTGAIRVSGGDTITVAQNAANTLNTTTTFGAVTVNGDAQTTEVTVTQTAAATESATVAGVANSTVTINDAGVAGATADTITTVTLANFGATTITSSALSTLAVTGGSTAALASGSITLTAEGTVSPATTLALNSGGGFMGAIAGTQADAYTTINVSSSAATTFADLNAAGVVTLNFTGAGNTTFTAFEAAQLAGLLDINVTGSGGVTLGSVLNNDVDFDGGAGNDSIIIDATTTLGITMGAGNDTVQIDNLVGTGLGVNGSVDGGAGNADVVFITGASAVAASANTDFESDISGFERLLIAPLALGAASTIDLANLDDINHVTLQGSTAAFAATISGFANGGTFAQTALLAAGADVILTGAFTGGADRFNINATSTDGFVNAGVLSLALVENITITLDDSDTTAPTAVFDLNLDAVNATTVTVVGDVGITFANSSLTALTTLDASGVTATGAIGAVTFTGNNIASTITGGAGNDALTGGTQDDTITGGAGDDAITGLAGNDRLIGDAGADVITGGAGADTMTGGTGADIFVVAATDATVDAAGVGRDVITDFNTGGIDVIRLAAGDNVAAADVVAGAGPLAAISASISAGGKVTFNAADDTLAEQIAVAIIETGVNEVVFWENGTSTFVYASGAAGDGTNDQLIELTGVTGLTTITETLTAGDFIIA